ncbi:hypothetical protein K439DRAFT_488832 [Ramaria rubella]|nr:hypothetical protein K439DRAFT_488832 [Ramaria rubella]
MLLISVLGNRSSTVSRPYQAVFKKHRCRLSHLQLAIVEMLNVEPSRGTVINCY